MHPSGTAVGRTVHYYPETPAHLNGGPLAPPRAAIITGVIGLMAGGAIESPVRDFGFGGKVYLTVFEPLSAGESESYRCWAAYSAEPAAGCWSFPPRV